MTRENGSIPHQKHDGYSAASRLDCYSCHHSRTDICFLAREGFPKAGPDCPAFLYEPGTDTEERP